VSDPSTVCGVSLVGLPAGTLGRVAEFGPYFAVSTGPVAEPGWRPVRAFYTDPAVLAGLVGRVRVRLGVGDGRVAASILVQGHAARLWSLSLGTWFHAGLVPDLHPDVLLWRDEDGSVRLHLERAQGWAGGHLEDVLAATVIGEHLAPMITAVHRLGPLSDRLLWGNAASALLGAARVIDGAPTGPARAVTDRLLNKGPLRGSIAARPDGGHRRRSCCLFYRVPGAGLCGDCALTHAPPPVGR